jgi:hypothetical protein
MAQLQSRRPHKLTEWDRQVLKHVAHKNGLSSIATLTTEFQTASGRNVSTRTVYRELHEVGYAFFFRLTNLGLVDCRRTLPASMHSANCKGVIMVWGVFSFFGLRPLSFSDNLNDFVLPTL